MDNDSHNQSTPPAARPSARGQAGRLIRLCAKEMREILRDRRTIVTLVLMPLLVYPILSLTFNRFLLTSFQGSSPDSNTLKVGFETKFEYDMFSAWYAHWQERLDLPLTLQPDNDEPQIEFVESQSVRQDVSIGKVDLMIDVKRAQSADPRVPRIDIEFLYAEDSIGGREAFEYLDRRIQALNEQYDRRVLRVGLPSRQNIELVTIDSNDEQASPFAAFIPLMLILMTITGAVYPAIDLTAGERERGTMEALIAAPVPRIGLLLAKYVAVLIVAILTATANLVAMTITLKASPLGDLLFGEAGISFTVMIQIYSLMILFASFFSAVLLAMTSFARSFKEAQAYLIPLMLVALGPGILSLIPGIELNATYAVLPLLNLVLLARDTIQSEVDPLLASVAVTSTLVYALAAITIAARIFGTDAILYGSEASWSDLFRAPETKPNASSVAGAMLSLALLFPLQFIAANEVSKIGSRGPSQRIPIRLTGNEPNSVQMPASAVQLVVQGVPEGFSIPDATRLEPGKWSYSVIENQTLALEATRPALNSFQLSFDWFDSSGDQIDVAAQSIVVEKDALIEGIRIGRSSLSIRLALTACLTFLLFVGVPMVAVGWQRVQWQQGLRLTRPNAISLIAAMIFGLSLWPIAHEIVVIGFQFGVGNLTGKIELVERLATELRGLSPFLILAAMALTPAVCEEFFFRGFLLQALSKKLNAVPAIVVSATLFGAFHLIGHNALAPERFLPSTFLGLFLGWLCVRTGSVLPGMLLHAIHNGLLMMITYYQPWLESQGWLVEEGDHLPMTWIAAALVAIAVAIGLTMVGTRRQPRTNQPTHQLSSESESDRSE